jgi:hypothetical protein
MNEKGLFVSIHRVNIKEGDQPATSPVGSSMLLRYMLDDCANVDEAIRKTETGIILPGSILVPRYSKRRGTVRRMIRECFPAMPEGKEQRQERFSV